MGGLRLTSLNIIRQFLPVEVDLSLVLMQSFDKLIQFVTFVAISLKYLDKTVAFDGHQSLEEKEVAAGNRSRPTVCFSVELM